MSDGLSVLIEPWGPTQARLTQAARAAARNPEVRALLKGADTRVLATRPLEDHGPRRRPRAAARFASEVYDYTNQRTVRVEGDLDAPARLVVQELGMQPLPSGEEFAAAVAVTRDDPDLGPALREGRLEPYRPMPPVLALDGPEGEEERGVTVGLRPIGPGARNEIVAVNLARGAVTRFEARAPATAHADDETCGAPDAGQPPTERGVPGSARITVKQGATVLWRLIATRPSASTGEQGSGIDLAAVDYRGKRVLRRAHVPILNVRYGGDACGPYRDWQFAESPFTAPGANRAPGFRLCSSPAKTVLEGAPDQGSFRGVAVYVQGQEVVLVSELEAGWYRYVSRWHLAADGTIRARFGFGAVQNSCVCNKHFHHAYWRLNFDIGAAARNRVGEWNDAPGPAPGSWRTLRFEQRRPKAPAWKRKWRVINTQSLAGYEIRPGANDGVADPWGVGDLWVVRFRADQVDDSAVATDQRAAIDAFVNGERVDDHDVVVWYAAHFTHDVHAEEHNGGGHIVGPDLVPFAWS